MDDNIDDASDSDMQMADSISDDAEVLDESKYDSEVRDSASSVSFVEDSDDDNSSLPSLYEEPQSERILSEQEIEELIAELLEVESKAAEAQESLEEESIAKLEIDVRQELSETLAGENLDDAVEDEICTFKEQWETVLDDLETESANLLEQLDGAGVELPALYKWIESQAPNGCCTETWKSRTLWAGSEATSNVNACIANAEKCLQTIRPMRRLHGKLLEEGASGFLSKKILASNDKNNMAGGSDIDWGSFNKIISSTSSKNEMAFGSKHWAFVYLASTPQQAAELGLEFPGADQVEEIDDIDGNSSDPFVADALANENTMEVLLPKNNFKKVKEEDDLNAHRRHQLRLKRKRHKIRTTKDIPLVATLPVENSETSNQSSHLHEPSQTENVIEKNLRNCNIGVELRDEKAEFSERSTCDFDMDKQTTKSNIIPQNFNIPDLTDNRGSKPTNCGDDDVCFVAQNNFFGCSNADNNAFNNRCVYDESLSLQGSRASIEVDISVEDKQKTFRCTVCDIRVVEVHQHPLLKVIICKNCKILVENKVIEKVDPDCYEGHCGWCGRINDLLSCKSCKVLFCSVCLKKNIGEGVLLTDSSSRCFCCSPHLLEQLSLELDVAVKCSALVFSSSDSDSDSSVRVINNQNGVFKKRKKKIRRILDDAELGEDTKKKIAIEKERQDHLKSLQAQFTAKAMIMNNFNYKGHMPEGATVDVLGDLTTGYIVNVVRDKGENAVRIPPTISAKLKAHQISGIRFMWENIVQSIGKVKSGDKGLGCILAHTMGLGKTFQVITFLYVTMRCVDLALRTALIVVPINVLHNWRHEFMKWRPMELKPLRVYMLEDVSRERRFELLAKWRAKGGVFLIGYSAFRNLSIGKNLKDRDVAKNICCALQDGPDILVCDEAHIIKNTKADTTQALKLVKCQRRIALTGSPLQNNLMEYYCMVDFVREGFLGSSHEFRNRFQNPIENGQHTNSTSMDVKIMNQRSHILYEQLKGFVQRMDVNVVKKDLPPKTVYVIAVKLSVLQRKLYKKCLSVHGFTGHKPSDERAGKRNFFAGYQALAQIWNHPGILQMKDTVKNTMRHEETVENFHMDDISSDENIDYNTVVGDKVRNKSELFHKSYQNIFQEVWWNDLLDENNYNIAEYSGKMVLLLDILMHCSELGDKALVFSQSIPTLDLIEIYLSRLRRKRREKFWKPGKDWFRIDGRTVGSERQKLVELFNDSSNKRVKCTLISTKAGSLGINLHAANRVIIVDGSWNPTYDLQAIYRAWRYGQKKPVFAYRLLAHGTMEEKIYNRQVTKEGLAARVVDRQQVYRTMSKEDIRHLFDFGDEENPETLGDLEKDNAHVVDQVANCENGNLWKQKLQLHENCVSDKLMENLLSKHRPRWIANYHEHETMLQENEEERLSKEEQDMAWEVYRKSLECEVVQQQQQQQQQQWIIDDSTVDKQRREEAANTYNPGLRADGYTPSPDMNTLDEANHYTLRNRMLFPPIQKCTNLSHMLTLRSQGMKAGCRTVCGGCAREISWDDPNRDTKTVRCARETSWEELNRDRKMST